MKRKRFSYLHKMKKLKDASDAYAAALMFYRSVKTAKKSAVAKAGTLYKDSAQRYPGKMRKAEIVNK